MIDNIRSQMRKGLLEYCILLVIDREPAYATEILDRLRAAQLVVVEGTLYPLLSRLKKAEVLAYYWVESPSGPPRKYFQITPQGKQLLADLEIEWANMAETVGSLHNLPDTSDK